MRVTTGLGIRGCEVTGVSGSAVNPVAPSVPLGRLTIWDARASSCIAPSWVDARPPSFSAAHAGQPRGLVSL